MAAATASESEHSASQSEEVGSGIIQFGEKARSGWDEMELRKTLNTEKAKALGSARGGAESAGRKWARQRASRTAPALRCGGSGFPGLLLR